MLDSKLLQPRARTDWRLWACIAIVGACAGLAGVYLWKMREQVVANQSRYDTLLRAARDKRPRAPSTADVEAEKHWSSLANEIRYPWDRVFQAVERADGADIELLELQPDKQAGSITLRGEARSNEALAAYLDRLAMQAVLQNVHLVRHQRAAHDRLEVLEFEIKSALLRDTAD